MRHRCIRNYRAVTYASHAAVRPPFFAAFAAVSFFIDDAAAATPPRFENSGRSRRRHCQLDHAYNVVRHFDIAICHQLRHRSSLRHITRMFSFSAAAITPSCHHIIDIMPTEMNTRTGGDRHMSHYISCISYILILYIFIFTIIVLLF